MYQIIQRDGTIIGVTDNLYLIKIGESGDYTPASESDAVGVAFEGVAYNLIGHYDIKSAPTVVVSKIDGGEQLFSQWLIVDKILLSILGG